MNRLEYGYSVDFDINYISCGLLFIFDIFDSHDIYDDLLISDIVNNRNSQPPAQVIFRYFNFYIRYWSWN